MNGEGVEWLRFEKAKRGENGYVLIRKRLDPYRTEKEWHRAATKGAATEGKGEAKPRNGIAL